MNEAPLGLLFSILVALIFLSGFFSSSETGMMSLNRYRLKHLKSSGHKGAKRVSKLLARQDRLIGLILIGNNLVNILASAIATVIAIRLWGDAGIAIATLLLTLVILIFAEITPKTLAARYPEKIAFPASLILTVLLRVFYPLVWLVGGITNGILKLFGVNPAERADMSITTDELRTIVNEAGNLIPDRHQGMLLNILELESVTVDDIMVPRSEVYGIDLAEADEVILKRIQASEYTRLPLYTDDINEVSGVLHMRTTSRFISEAGLDRNKMLAEAAEPYFIPEGTPLHTQLLNFQRKKNRMAVVVDEYGVLMGLVALEDILEEIVGEFTSNLAETIEDIYPQKDGSYIINGSATVRDINKSLEWLLPTEGPKTLSGLLLEHLEGFPDGNVCINIEDYRLEILELRDNVVQAARASEASSQRR
ncbi:HlyC/CorC family transporter [Halieaceae bacterium IMCC14734]|uniref:HlyC/CorC family transporter n=1 Tax=Candidatus Litorirhabdus singularis TaxID=2518993 RepID=A0ABT3THM3_9GAMM|nr:HlyC/CorC family transporter [Candidatus Litorirhabdus singularis]MCX2981798.1 HlyC/CorC family transporter [Candidatus Litorirhabdus singularis]